MNDSLEKLQAEGVIDSKNVATIKICLVQFFGACIAAVLLTQIFAVWLDQGLHLDSLQIGELMGLKTIVAIFYKPIFGYLLDKSQLRIWFIITLPIVALGSGHFLQFIYKPLILTGDPSLFYAAGLLGGVFFGYTVIAGQAAMFSYCGRYIEAHGGSVDKIGASNNMGWLVMSLCMTMLYTLNPMWSFYLASFAGLCMIVMLFSLKVKPFDRLSTVTTSKEKIKLVDLKFLARNPRFYVLALFSITVMVVVYAQYSQVGRYTLSFWPADKQMMGLRIGQLLNTPVTLIFSVVMLYSSALIKKVSASKSLLILGGCYAVSLLALGLAGLLKEHMDAANYIPSLVCSVFANYLLSITNPFTMVVVLSYVNVSFDKRVTGTAFLIGFHFVCNLGGSFGSMVVGGILEAYGWATTYLLLPAFIVVSLIAVAGLMHYANLYDKKRIIAHLGKKLEIEEPVAEK